MMPCSRPISSSSSSKGDSEFQQRITAVRLTEHRKTVDWIDVASLLKFFMSSLFSFLLSNLELD